jgi:hypothetical protein
MKSKYILIGAMFAVIASFAQTNRRIVAVVEGVYENSVLLNWSQKKPIYGKSHSDELESQGNFIGGVPIKHEPPIIGYETVSSKEVLVVNYPIEGIAEGEKIDIYAVQIGTTNFSGHTIELWDAGMAKLTPEKIEQMKEWQAQTDAFNEKQKAKAQEAAQAKKFLIQSNAVRWLQPQATNGDASAQCSLGLHYLNGQGCETNREQAIYWLTQAANQGDQEASNKLASLKK